MCAPRLLVDISSHGFGHFAQAAPILNQLQLLMPELDLTIRCGLPVERLQTRLQGKWQHIQATSDFGFVMIDASRINHDQTAARYRAFHTNWQERLQEETKKIEALKPDLVLTNVAYLPLAAAHQAGIASLSMSSLNWADLFGYFYGKEPWGSPIHAQMLDAYRKADHFIRLTPAMPMESFEHQITMPPVASLGKSVRQALLKQFNITENSKLILVAFGGFDKEVDIKAWPQIKNVHWIVPSAWLAERSEMSALESCGVNFTNLIKSVDSVLTKPGYGTFTEAACNGTPVLYVPRDDWPEQDCLIKWLNDNARCQSISETDLNTGNLQEALFALLENSAPPTPVPEGSLQVAKFIAEYLS